jgi:hypothetical protein
MKKASAVLISLFIVRGFCLIPAQAQDGRKTLNQILDAGTKIVETELVPAAEAMPEEKY